MRLFKMIIFRFFDNFLMSPKGPPSIFLIFCNKLDFQKAQRVPPFTIFDIVRFFEIIFCHKNCFFSVFKNFALLSLRYSADFRRSRLVLFALKPKKSIACNPKENVKKMKDRTLLNIFGIFAERFWHFGWQSTRFGHFGRIEKKHIKR